MEKKLSLWDRRESPTAGSQDYDRETTLLRESLRTLAIENEALRADVRDLRALHDQLLDRLEQQAPQLQRLSWGHAQLQASLTHVHQRMMQADQLLNGMYDSRIWRTLVMAGGLVERVLGRGNPPPHGAPAGVGVAPSKNLPAETSGFPYCLDEPMEGQVVYFHEMIVRGWALFPEDLGKIEAAVDEQP